MKPGRPKKSFRLANPRNNRILEIAAIVFITFLVYGETYSYEILFWDDNVYLYDNPVITNLSWQGIAKIFSTFYASNYHPLTTISWMGEYAIAGFDPRLFHLTNLLLHLVNSLLAFIFTRRLLSSSQAGIIAALLFCIHPMHVESVAWISERKDLLFTLFSLLSLNAYLTYIRKSVMSQYLLSLFFFLLSLLSKSAAVILPGLIMVIDYFKHRKFDTLPVLDKIPFILLSILFSYLALRSQVVTTEAGFAPRFELWQQPFVASYALVFYFISFVFPVGMSPLHPYPELPGKSFYPYFTAFLILIGLVFLVVFLLRRYKHTARLVLSGIGFFVIALVPILQFVPVGQAIVADRYTYLPYLGLSLIVAWLITQNRMKAGSLAASRKWILWVLFAGFSIFLVVQTKIYIKTWKTTISLFTGIVERHPDQYWSWYGLGRTRMEYNDFDGAIRDLTVALGYAPANTTIRYLRSQAYMRSGNFSRVINDLDTIIMHDPVFLRAYINRGSARGMMKDYRGSVSDFTKALEIQPNDTGLLVNRGLSYWYAGCAQEACRDWESAMSLGSVYGSFLLKQKCH